MQRSATYRLALLVGLIGACDGSTDALSNGIDRPGAPPPRGGSAGGGGADGPVPTDSSSTPDTEGKTFFASKVYPSLVASCGGCHETGPGPAWIKTADVEVSYKMMFQLGYVSAQSRIVLKGPHQGSTGTTPQQNEAFTQWVNLELASPNGQGLGSVLDKLGACLDKTTFDAIGLGSLRTVPRTTENNVYQVTPWVENQNNCTGCRNVACRTCHSGDDATGFVLAVGNANLPATFTFDQTKLTSPPYLQKFFGISATGEPIASNAIRIKAEATQKDQAYRHPMYLMDTGMQSRIDAFVNATIAKYKTSNGACQ